MYNSDRGSSKLLCVSCVSAEPRQLSPSEATQNNGHPIMATSILQVSITLEMSQACSLPFSLLQVPAAMKGREADVCLFLESIPIEKTIA